jgi:hypothetical protein
VNRYLLFITIYDHLLVLWLVVAYSGLSNHALLGYELGPINISLLTNDCLLTSSSSLFIAYSLPIPSISTIRIEDYLFCPSYRDCTVSQALVISKAPALLGLLSPSYPSCNNTTIVARFCILFFSISIIFLFARDNWRHRHNTSGRELVYLVYPVDTAKEFHLLVYTYFTPLQPGHPRSSIDLHLKRSVWCWCAQKLFSVLHLVGICVLPKFGV